MQLKKKLIILLTCLLVLQPFLSLQGDWKAEAASPFAGGDGTVSNPYQITTADQLNEVRNYMDKNFIVMNDINLSSYTNWVPLKNTADPYATAFTGSFNGNGKTISHLTINSDTNYTGLFSKNEGVIKNINLEYVKITSTGHYVGGLVGENHGTISQSSIYSPCCDGYDIESTGFFIGGLVGGNYYIIENSYSHIGGNIKGNMVVGGLVGANGQPAGTIRNSYAASTVVATAGTGGGFSGPLIGNNQEYSIITNSYYVSSQGLTGLGASLTYQEAINSASYTGWDFTDIWNNDGNSSLPHLRAPFTPATDLGSIPEDTTSHEGFAAGLFDSGRGIIITYANNTNGQWQYLDNDNRWQDMINAADEHGYLLGANRKFRFIPNKDWHGETTFSYRKWIDPNWASGAVNTLNWIDAGINLNGHTNAYDSNVTPISVKLTVTPANDAPYLTEVGGSSYLDFGANQYVSYPDLGDAFYSSSFTYESWVNVKENQTWARFFDSSYGTNNFNIHLAFDDKSKKISFEAIPNKTGARAKITTNEDFPLNKWVHVAAVYDANAEEAYIYWDGVLKAQGSMNLDNMANAASNNTSITVKPNNYLGKSTWNDGSFIGAMKDVRFWNKAKTEQEIKSQMNDFVTTSDSSLILNYKFDDAQATTAVDSSSNNYNGTITGAKFVSKGFTKDVQTDVAQTVTKDVAVVDVDNDDLTIEATSSNTSLVPNDNIVITEDGATKSIAVTPAPDQYGSTTITVTVDDGTLSYSSSFEVLVNATFSIQDITDQTLKPIYAGYASGTQETKTVTITKGGTGPLTNVDVQLSGTNASSFEVTTPDTSELTSIQPNTTFTVKAKDSLPVGTYKATVTVSAEDVTPVTFEVTQVVNTAPAGGGSIPATETITVPVETGSINTGTKVAETPITRTRETNGTVKDTVTLTTELAKETVQSITNAGQNTARIVVPDAKDEVSQVNINVPNTATKELSNANVNLEIFTNNVTINIPQSSLDDFNEDLYFKVVPLKDQNQQAEVEQRAKAEEKVKEIANGLTINLLGRPMTIETNMQSRPVTLKLPLRDTTIPTDAKEREAFLAALAVFVEHSDGEKEIIKPTLIEYKNGEFGVQFSVNKFSTFSILKLDGLQNNSHEAYIKGYADNTFKPDASVTRAQMAAMLARNLGYDETKSVASTYPDVASNYWAQKAIEFVKEQGLMKGDEKGNFNPLEPITRAQMAAILARYKNLPLTTENSENAFSDIKGHWAAEEITAIKNAGLINGYSDGTYRPNRKLTRAEAVKMVNRMFNRGPLYGVTTSTFKDVPSTHWAFYEIAEASQNHFFTQRSEGGETLVK